MHTPSVTRLTVYRIAHLRWDGAKWAFAGYHESRYYLTRRAAQRKADQLGARRIRRTTASSSSRGAEHRDRGRQAGRP